MSCTSHIVNKPVPHKHAAVIKAWADGLPVEIFILGSWQLIRNPRPHWNISSDFRIQPSYPTLGEIAKKAWHITLNNSADNCIHAASGDDRWKCAAKAVADAIKSGEYSPSNVDSV